MASQSISPEVIVKGFLRSAAYPMQWMGLMMICCGIAVKMGNLGMSECEEDESSDCEYGHSDTNWYREMEYDMLCVLSIRN